MSVRQNGVIIAGSGSGSVDVDNSTITTNAMDEIQAVATINANTAAGATNPVYDWVGTLAEHTAQDIANQHPDWICYITDDINGGTSVYTKSEVDTLLAGKVDTGNEIIEYQAPTSGNNYTWYCKYKNGWVIQGGRQTGSTSVPSGGQGQFAAITLPVPMANNAYVHLAMGEGYVMAMHYSSSSTTFRPIFGAYGQARTLTTVFWLVAGKAA